MKTTSICCAGRTIPVYAAVSGLLDFATGQVLNADGGFHIRRL